MDMIRTRYEFFRVRFLMRSKVVGGISVWGGDISRLAERTDGAVRSVHGGTFHAAPFVFEGSRVTTGPVSTNRSDVRSRVCFSPVAPLPSHVMPDHAGRAFPRASGPLSHPVDPEPVPDASAGLTSSRFPSPRAQDVPESDGLRWQRNL